MVKFRTINGSNNHPNDLGEADSLLIRLLQPAYEDGFNLPRGITESQPNNPFIGPSRLPNPRNISNAISAQNKLVFNAKDASDWIWQWGQFLDHDLDLNEGGDERFFIAVDENDPIADRLNRVDNSESNLSSANVSSGQSNISSIVGSEELIFPFLGNTAPQNPIIFDNLDSNSGDIIVDADGDFGIAQIEAPNENQPGTPFIPLTRITAAPGTGIEGNPRGQINEITSFIDGSQVYGSEEELAEFLRANDGTGELKSQIINGEELLPFNPENPPSFIAGDPRVNEQIGLISAHTLFVRQHNSIAEDIARRIEAGDSDILGLLEHSELEENDFIYESARKVVSAQIQQITYEEYLPLLIGKNLVEEYSGYDETVDPRVSVEFANVSFRLGHSQLSPEISRVNPDGTSAGDVSLDRAFFTPQQVIDNGADSIAVGLTTKQAQAVDNLVIDSVRNFLFPARTGGFDLAAVNIQRGRDVGLPSYNDARRGLGLQPATAFLTTDTQQGITSDPEVAARFASIYESVEQVDFWIGGISEDPVNGGLVGELFSKVLTDQFTRLRDGDRFFYLNHLENLSILDPDFEETTLSNLIRNNTDEDYIIQDNAFIVPSLDIDALNNQKQGLLEFVVTLSDVSSSIVTVDFETINGTATEGEDYLDSSGTLTFNPGETSKTIAVNLLNDSVLEDNETVLVKIGNASNNNIEDNLAVSQPIVVHEIKGTDSDNKLKGKFGNDLIESKKGNDKIFGLFGNNYLDGGEGNDKLNGGFGNDTQLGSDGNDKLNGGFGKDTQLGGDGNDILKGGFGNDIQIGGNGNDSLNGDFGDDELTGVGNNFGMGEIDSLTGGFGKDTFNLGDKNNVFYHGKGIFDYALIKDFQVNQDTIVLNGSESNYVLGKINDADLPKGTGLYFDVDNSADFTTGVDDLIAVVTQNVSNFDRGFSFV
jgi:hypothetical protein